MRPAGGRAMTGKIDRCDMLVSLKKSERIITRALAELAGQGSGPSSTLPGKTLGITTPPAPTIQRLGNMSIDGGSKKRRRYLTVEDWLALKNQLRSIDDELAHLVWAEREYRPGGSSGHWR